MTAPAEGPAGTTLSTAVGRPVRATGFGPDCRPTMPRHGHCAGLRVRGGRRQRGSRRGRPPAARCAAPAGRRRRSWSRSAPCRRSAGNMATSRALRPPAAHGAVRDHTRPTAPVNSSTPVTVTSSSGAGRNGGTMPTSSARLPTKCATPVSTNMAARPVSAENRVTGLISASRPADLPTTVRSARCMIPRCALPTRLSPARPRSELAGAARPIRSNHDGPCTGTRFPTVIVTAAGSRPRTYDGADARS
jgi:hypothetical protein